jgi:hypothetical protein
MPLTAGTEPLHPFVKAGVAQYAPMPPGAQLYQGGRRRGHRVVWLHGGADRPGRLETAARSGFGSQERIMATAFGAVAAWTSFSGCRGGGSLAYGLGGFPPVARLQGSSAEAYGQISCASFIGGQSWPPPAVAQWCRSNGRWGGAGSCGWLRCPRWRRVHALGADGDGARTRVGRGGPRRRPHLLEVDHASSGCSPQSSPPDSPGAGGGCRDGDPWRCCR